MGVYVQTKYGDMPGNDFVLFSALVQHLAPLCLQWQLLQLFPAAYTGDTR
jgi:hypothetical protein